MSTPIAFVVIIREPIPVAVLISTSTMTAARTRVPTPSRTILSVVTIIPMTIVTVAVVVCVLCNALLAHAALTARNRMAEMILTKRRLWRIMAEKEAAEESDAQGREEAGVAHHEAEEAADDDRGERVHARDARRGLDRLAEGDDEDGVEVAEVGPLVNHVPRSRVIALTHSPWRYQAKLRNMAMKMAAQTPRSLRSFVTCGE